jgi:hypothetical protein
MPHRKMGFLFHALPTIAGYCVWVRVKLGSRESPPVCCVLHRITFSVASEWCQESVDYASPVALRSICE